jgi:FKBP-type peptidyl-prolyl cis-trans isomerase 2
MKIAPGKRVSVHYMLYADGPEKELIEETRQDDPMIFTYGDDPMLPKFDEELFQEGEIIPLESPEGDIIEGVVCEVKLNSIVLDFNHPLAGEDLLFEGEVVGVE